MFITEMQPCLACTQTDRAHLLPHKSRPSSAVQLFSCPMPYPDRGEMLKRRKRVEEMKETDNRVFPLPERDPARSRTPERPAGPSYPTCNRHCADLRAPQMLRDGIWPHPNSRFDDFSARQISMALGYPRMGSASVCSGS